MENLQHAAIDPHPEHLAGHTVIVCYHIPSDVKRAGKRLPKALWERRGVKVEVLLLLLLLVVPLARVELIRHAC